jgi:hypothetical protein
VVGGGMAASCDRGRRRCSRRPVAASSGGRRQSTGADWRIRAAPRTPAGVRAEPPGADGDGGRAGLRSVA